MLNNMTPAARLAYRPTYFTSLLTAASLNKAYISYTPATPSTPSAPAASGTPTHPWRSCAVIMPPGTDVGNPFTLLQSGLLGVVWTLGLGVARKMLGEFEGAVNAARRQGLAAGEEAYYVFFVGTGMEYQGRGLGGGMVRECMERAGGEGRAVWLEATTEGSRRLYRRLGFVEVREIVLGGGKAAKTGEVEKGGEGVRIWAMVWRNGGAKA